MSNTLEGLQVYDPQSGDYEPAVTIDREGNRRGTVIIGAGVTARAVFYPGEQPDYVRSHSSLIDASSSEQYEKHGYSD